MNAVEIEEAVSALSAAAFDATEFPYVFLAAFGNKETALKRLRSGSNNNSDIPGAVLQRSNIHLAVCAPGAVTAKLVPRAGYFDANTLKRQAAFRSWST